MSAAAAENTSTEEPQVVKMDPGNPGKWMSAAATENTSTEEPRLLGNPGFLGHPYGCKPCNKYRPERPDDSCKKADNSTFCHGKVVKMDPGNPGKWMSAAAAENTSTEEPQAFKIDPDNPGNPGSLGHPYGCKPCNKYRPERPDDSCKNARNCTFCHGKEHERQKHRGQRGRHALQRRQFLESRGGMNPKLAAIIDRIYKEPHETIDDIKRQLREQQKKEPQFMPNSPEWDKEVDFVVQKIGKIGEKVQNKRPDNVRVRKARQEQPESSQLDLEGRCKWYTGTLHLMVRKMWDEQKPEPAKLEEIRQIVTESLREFKDLSKQLERRLGPEGRLEDQVKMAAGVHLWLIEPLTKLVEKEAKAESMEVTDITNLEVWNDLKKVLPRLREEAVEGKEQQDAICSAVSLEDMLQVVEDQVEKDQKSILAALDPEESD